MKEAYALLEDPSIRSQRPGWQIIWKLRVQQRIRMFVWLMTRDSLMTNYNRWRRSMATSFLCTVCEEEDETTLHAVRDSESARRIWSLLVPLDSQQKFFNLGLQDWVVWNLSNMRLSIQIEDWGRRFAIARWWIWRWRNEAVFHTMQLTDAAKVQHIIQSDLEMRDAWA